MTDRETLLVTGAAGHVASLILPSLRADFRLRRLDLAPQRGEGDDEILSTDICDVEALTKACSGVSGVLHLAAKAFEDDFLSVLLPRNVVGTWAVFEAAVRAEVPRFVFASTAQTVEGNPAEEVVGPERPPRPISVYACTKLFGEALGRYHSDVHGLGVACLRLGCVVAPDSPLFATEPSLPTVWCGPADLARLVAAAFRSDVRFATVLAVSPPATERFDVANPFGWQPEQVPA